MIQAGSMGVPYVPVVGLVGSDLLAERDDMRLHADPFEPERQTLVAKAYRPDVALLHGVRADRAGNVDLGHHADGAILAEASRRVIVTVEEVVERLEPTEQGRFLPSLLVDAVVEARFGAHPAGCPGSYPMDAEHLRGYLAAAESEETFAAYLDQTVRGVPDHGAYVERFVPRAWQAPAGAGALSRSA